MLVASKKLFYAIEAVLFIAYNAKAGPISGRDLAEQQKLPARYLEPMMQRLVRAGVLRGVRGPQGGYVLGRERRRITLGDICAAVGASTALPEKSTPLGEQVLRPQAMALEAAWKESLSSLTIAHLCDRAAQQRIAHAYHPVHDFAI